MTIDIAAERAENEKRKAIYSKATKGPWMSRKSPVQPESYKCIYFGPSKDELYNTSALQPADADFIAFARNDTAPDLIDRLLDELERRQVDDPALDCTDAAHPAWWRGHDQAIKALCMTINGILDGELIDGVCSEPWESTRKRIAGLRRVDDGKPWDLAWINRAGIDCGELPDEKHVAFGDGTEGYLHFSESPRLVWIEDEEGNVTACLKCETRGQVRNLCSALHIELKEVGDAAT